MGQSDKPVDIGDRSAAGVWITAQRFIANTGAYVNACAGLQPIPNIRIEQAPQP